MSMFSTAFESVAHLPDARIDLILVAKWTLLLALAWLAHTALAGRNPRWRVALWRGAILGVATVAVLAAAPPIVKSPIALDVHPVMVARQERPDAPIEVSPASPAIVASTPEAPTERVPAATPRAMESAPIVAPPSPAGPWLPRMLRLAISWAPSIWLAGVALLAIRLILSAMALDRLVRRSSDAPEDIARACRAIAGHLGCTRAVRVVRSGEVATPCLAGVLRPVMLLPESEGQRPDDLAAILAHELAHARHRDLAWNLAAHLASILLWFHPLAWRLRTAHATACDAVSDAVAADYLGDVASYGRILARLALEASSPAPAHVLAMARTSEVWRRLDALNRRVFRAPLSRRQAWPALGFGAGLVVVVGGLGVGRAGQAGDRQQIPARPTLELRAVAAETGAPIQGATIAYEGMFGETPRQNTLTTDANGATALPLPPGVAIKRLQVKAAAPRRVPVFLAWDRGGPPIELPASKELRFEPGTVIGGIVRDVAGQPVAGATIVRSIAPAGGSGSRGSWRLVGPKTDHRGRWRTEDASADVDGLEVEVVHPDYETGRGPVSHNLQSVVVLRRVYPVRGRVVDASGRPVRGAGVVVGASAWERELPSTRTTEGGEFVVGRCPEGPTIATVQADGFAPQMRDIRVDANTSPLEFRLAPGAALRLRITDAAGKPVEGAFVFAQTWRGQHSLGLRERTDAEGRFTWRGAPADAVLYDFGKTGYMARRRVPLTASDRELVVVLDPELTITGRITDGETGRPIPGCLVVEGVGFPESDQIHWSRRSAKEATDGVYTATFEEPAHAMYVRAEAVGYEPAVSRAFRPGDGKQVVDFALRPSKAIAGLVELRDGKPAAGIEVVLSTGNDQVLLEAGRFTSQTTAPRVTTGPDGRFAFSTLKGPFLLIAASDPGYSEASSDDFARSGKLVLKPWGRLEGEVRAGGRPTSHEEITFSPREPAPPAGRRILLVHQYTTQTDDRGRFRFERVVPGPGGVSRVLVTNFGRITQHMTIDSRGVVIKPGGLTTVQFIREGRPVVGRVVLDGRPTVAVDWTRHAPAYLIPSGREADPAALRPASNLDGDGRFRFEAVAPGAYDFFLSVHETPAHRDHNLPFREIARVQVALPEILADPSGTPFDAGTIAVKPFEALGPGDSAPEFRIPRIAGAGKGDEIRLDDYRGRLVVVDFWTAACDQCRADLQSFKEIARAFPAERCALISVSCEQTADRARQIIREDGLSWTHGIAEGFGSGILQAYKVHTLPSTFLIGANGRVLATNLRGAALKAAIAWGLNDGPHRAGRPSP